METSPDKAPQYTSYLLRLRCIAGPASDRVDREGRSLCQVMLQNVATEERRYFGNLAGLIAFLEEQTRSEVLSQD